jgi:DNA-directed RNA polymerase subunit RPC12/RpoP
MDSHLIIICEECGKKYRVDTAKILGEAAGFGCRSCGHRIRVSRPPATVRSSGKDAAGQQPEPGSSVDRGLSVQAEPATRPARRAGISLRAKALLLFFIVPAAVAAAAGFLFLDQAEELVSSGDRETFFLLLLLWGGVVLAALAIGPWFGLKLAGRIRRLAEAAERIIPVRPGYGDDLGRLEEAVARIQDVMRPQGAGK